MFDYMWSKNNNDSTNDTTTKTFKFSKVVPTVWSEHCIECAAPICYSTCPNFEKREDGQCVRVKNGIHPVSKTRNCLSYLPVRVHFKKWAKIECLYNNKPLNYKKIVKLYKSLYKLDRISRNISKITPLGKRKWIFTKAWYSFRIKKLKKLMLNKSPSNNLYLVMETRCPNHAVDLLLDIKTQNGLIYREKISLPKDTSLQKIKLPPINIDSELHYLNLHPTNVDSEEIVDFNFLEIIEDPIFEDETITTPAKKVKCVIWDLDNTLWDGVLIEDKVKIRTNIVDVIKSLDEKGIVNSICSKNDEQQALAKLEEYGIKDYFVFPKINWEPKSLNIKTTIEQMNINPNTVVFIDDSEFERTEVKESNPAVTVVDIAHIESEFSQEKYNVKVTADSKSRRETYKQLEKQTKDANAWSGNIDEFLKTCNIKINISRPTQEDLPRCYELLQRTNQLNASGRRLSEDELNNIYNDENYDCYIIKSSDKYGNYGSVGFSIVNKAGCPTITDFVISCRIANKTIEHAFLLALAKYYNKQGYSSLNINYKKTNVNGPMFKVVNALNMIVIDTLNDVNVYSLQFDKITYVNNIVNVSFT